MKVMFDTNIYVSWIQGKEHEELILKFGTVKYMSAVVLMELWAGARSKRASRIIETLQRPYLNAGRVVPLTLKNYITAGQLISDLPASHKNLVGTSDFVNDIQIALTALSVGAALYTSNRKHYKIINSALKSLHVVYV